MNDTKLEAYEMCRSLAKKYKNASLYEDMVHEGYVAILEALETDPDAPVAKLYRVANRRMHDYMNIDMLPVSVPITTASRSIARGAEMDDTQSYSDKGIESLTEAIRGTQVCYDDEFSSFTPDCSERYEEIDYQAYVAATLITKLSVEEFNLIKMRYYQDMTLWEVADILGVTAKTISLKENEVLHKLKQFVM